MTMTTLSITGVSSTLAMLIVILKIDRTYSSSWLSSLFSWLEVSLFSRAESNLLVCLIVPRGLDDNLFSFASDLVSGP